MNLKLRFALLFTFFVTVILLICCFSIHILYYNAREEDYYKRVGKEGAEVYNFFMDIKQDNPKTAYKLIKEIHDKALIYEEVFILDSAGTVIFRFPDTLQVPHKHIALDKLKTGKENRFIDAQSRQHVAMYIPETNSYIFASGYDRTGFARINILRIILVIVFFGGMILSAFISFLFVRQAVKPLKDLGSQMKKTTVQNLTERVIETKVNDEINDIARNFNAMLERLSKSFEFQKNFVYHASHELRTPLATMLSQTESALNREELSAKEYKNILISLKEEQQEMIELTNSLLLISQFEHMGYVQDWPKLRIDELIYETVSHNKKMLPGLQINITFASLPENDDDFIIRGNETLLKSAFSNLIKNAYTYSVDQKVYITIDSDGKAIFVHLDNSGTQLPTDEKESIMVPFFRGGNALTTKGYGLGLSIVYRFIAIHKGTVTYTPLANDMNRFTVTLNKA